MGNETIIPLQNLKKQPKNLLTIKVMLVVLIAMEKQLHIYLKIKKKP